MKIVLFGCGQGGQMVKKWIPACHQLLAFTDNNPTLWGSCIEDVPVLPPRDLLSLSPDLVWITLLNQDAALSVSNQLRELGFHGEIQFLKPLRQKMDLRLSHLRLLAEEINRRRIPGAVAELGVYKGEFSAEINRLFPDRELYLFDTFEGFHPSDLEIEEKQTGVENRFRKDFRDTSMEEVRNLLPYPKQAVFCPGHFPESLPQTLPSFVFVSLDPDLYEPVRQGLQTFWPRLSKGGVILIHDYNSTQFPGVGKAVRRFCEENSLMVLPLSDLHGSAVLIKQ